MRLAGFFIFVAGKKTNPTELVLREWLCFDYILQVTPAQCNEYTDFLLHSWWKPFRICRYTS